MTQQKLTCSDVPEEKGTYLLWFGVTQLQRVSIGRLGEFDIVPGYYAYLGSAHGHGGLKSRIQHHLANATRHWHIDYLMPNADPVEIWFAMGDRKLESQLAEILQGMNKLKTPIPRFGASDYRRSRITHLFYTKRRLSFRWFEQIMHQTFENLSVRRFGI